LGIMFTGLSVGAFTGAVFHLTTHAFFKALLFLAAGSVIHALGGEQDIRNMGGLKKTLPRTYGCFLIGALTIAGIPPLAGFFSKDEILVNAFAFNHVIWFFLFIATLLTAFYMLRVLFLTFNGKFHGAANPNDPLHESPRIMIFPMIALGLLSILGGVINLPELTGGNASLEKFLSPVFAASKSIMQYKQPVSHSTGWILTGITLLGVLIIGYRASIRYTIQQKGVFPDETKKPFLVNLISGKYYIDELYDFLFVKPVLWLSGFLHRVVEIRLIDGIVNGFGNLVIRTGNTIRYLQTGNIGFYLLMMILGIILILLFNVVI